MSERVTAGGFGTGSTASAAGLPAARETVPMNNRVTAAGFLAPAGALDAEREAVWTSTRVPAAFSAIPATDPGLATGPGHGLPAARKRVPMATWGLAAALTASLAAPTAAQDTAPPAPTVAPAVETAVSTATAAVGDPVTVVVTVRHAPGTEVRWPDPVDAAPFELLDPPVVQSAAVDGGVESRLELRVAAFELGELSFPSLDVEVVETGGEATTLTTEEVPVAIESVGRDEGGDIRDIKGPLAIPFAVVTLLPWLAAALAIAAGAAWIYRRYRRRSQPEALVPALSPRPAHEVAREALEALEAARLLERGEVKTYHIRLSDILRVYIEGRFRVEAMEMTTGEVLDGLRRADTDGGVVADVRRLLDRCDLVKFAKLRPATPECRELLPLARRVVDVTAPVEPAPAGPAAIPAEQTA